MAFVPTPNTVKVCLNFLQNGEQTCQVFHVDVGEEPTEIILLALAQKFRDWFINFADGVVDDNTSLQDITCTDVSAPEQEGVIYNDSLPHAGAVEGNPLPNNSTVCTKLSSGFTGRSRRGRKYAVGLNDTMIEADGQHLTDTFQAAFDAVYQQLITAMITEGWKLVVNSLVSGGAPRAEGLNTEIIAATTNLVLDSQRRRLPGRGM